MVQQTSSAKFPLSIMSDSAKKKRHMMVQVSGRSLTMSVPAQVAQVWRESAEQTLRGDGSLPSAKAKVFDRLKTIMQSKDFRFLQEKQSELCEYVWDKLQKGAADSGIVLTIPTSMVEMPSNVRPRSVPDQSVQLNRCVAQAIEDVGLKDICRRWVCCCLFVRACTRARVFVRACARACGHVYAFSCARLKKRWGNATQYPVVHSISPHGLSHSPSLLSLSLSLSLSLFLFRSPHRLNVPFLLRGRRP